MKKEDVKNLMTLVRYLVTFLIGLFSHDAAIDAASSLGIF